MGDRRSQIDRRASRASQQPPDEQLALFANASGGRSEMRAAAIFSVLLRARMISGAIPTSFGPWTGLKALRILSH